MIKILKIAILATALGATTARSQLAITEVMTSESTNTVPSGLSHPDWWELSNFGTNDLDLTGYSWNDNSHNGLFAADATPFNGVTIHAGEAIVFAQQTGDITDADGFRAWWGIDPSVQVFLYSAADPGLGAGGDSVRVWRTNNVDGSTFDISFDEALQYQVDRADTGVAIEGHSLVYNPSSGTFDLSSSNGIGGAFMAVTADDEGSPGVMPVQVPVTITQQPTNFTTTVGQSATFTIAGRGLPRPTYQWLSNGTPVDGNAPGVAITYAAGVGTLSLANVQTNQAGTYSAIINNGLTNFSSSNAVLIVSAALAAPSLTQLPVSINAYPGQTATFIVHASGNPTPDYQWQFSGGAIAGAIGSITTNQLVLSISDTNQSGTYTCLVSNSQGSTNASATLNVAPKPNLVITEVMSSEAAPTTHHGDWWELSNFGDTPVDLHGYRMNDSHALTSAYTITNTAVIQPGESIVFIERNVTAGSEVDESTFRAWWGSNLPPDLQIIAYDGTGRGLSGSGDEVRLWNQAATLEADRVAAVSFSTAAAGVSFTFDPQYTDPPPIQNGFTGHTTDGLSTNGVNGAFVAAQSGDTGSPGRLVNWPGSMNITKALGGFQLSWFSQPNWDYFVQYKDELSDFNWITLTNVTSGNTNAFGVMDPTLSTQRFYRVGLNPHK